MNQGASRFRQRLAGALLSTLCTAALPHTAWSQDCSGLPSFAPRTAYPAPEQASEMSVADFNRDGRLDVVLAMPFAGNVSVLLGNAGGGLGAPVNTAVSTDLTSVAVGDFNRDGLPDVAAARFTAAGGVFILLGNGAGGFAAGPTLAASFAKGAVVADFNSDGRDDVAVGSSAGAVRFLGNGDGTFGAAGPAGPANTFDTAAGDLDRDGRSDLVFVARGTDRILAALGDGTGGFGAPTPYAVANQPGALRLGDVNHDGVLDVVLAASGALKVIDVLVGNGAGGFAPATSYPLGGFGGGDDLALADFDGDGDLDAAVPRNGAFDVTLLPGNGDGTFGAPLTAVIPNNPYSIVAGDFNRDGRGDMAVSHHAGTGSVNVFLNATGIPCADASLGPAPRAFPTGGQTPTALALGRLDGDGRHDVVVANSNGNSVAVLLSTGPGTFGTPVSFPVGVLPVDLALGDLNGDSRLDLVVSNNGSNAVSVLLGDGAGGFGAPATLPVGPGPAQLALRDVDEDGRLDLAVAQYGAASVGLMLGDGAGGFGPPANIPVGTNPRALKLADLNADGHLDLLTGNFGSNDVSVRLGDGTGSFGPLASYPLGLSTTALTLGDFDNDGRHDVASVSDLAGLSAVLLGDGAGGFGPPVSWPVGTNPQDVAVVDVNRDGNPDMVVANMGSGDVSVRLGDGAGGFGPDLRHGGLDAPYAAVPADVDEDGAADLLLSLAAANEIAVLSGTGLGFETLPSYPALPLATNAAAGDLDRNGRLDLVATGFANDVAVLIGDGAGAFAAPSLVPVGANVSSPALGDLNRDGRLDLVAANNSASQLLVLLGDGAGGFGAPAAYPSAASAGTLVIADFDRDGRLDVVLARTGGGGRVTVLLGNGTGGLAAPADFGFGDSARWAVAGDFNRDGKLDVATSDAGADRVTVLIGNGDGTFALGPSAPLSHSGRVLAVADLNRDGRLDLAVGSASTLSSLVSILPGNGDGTFGPAATLSSGPAARPSFADVTLDGRLDLLVTHSLEDRLSVWPGDGAGGFGPAVHYALPDTSLTALAGDLKRDGRVDVAVTTAGGGGRVVTLLNTNCSPRRLRLAPDVSGCNTPGVPFTGQPKLRVIDDGANVNQCDADSVSAAIVPGSGSFGAVLSGTNPVSAVSGVASFTDLAVDLPGRGYRLSFAHPQAPAAWSRRFSQAPTVSIAGPASFCQTGSATYNAGGGWDSYAWTLDAASVGTDLRNVTLAGVAPGAHTLDVSVTLDGCTAGTSRPISVAADLSAVSISTPGPTSVCPACAGGTATSVETGGGGSTHQWGYRTLPGGSFIGIPGETASAYVIDGADFPGPGTYYLVARATPTCGAPLVSNEITVYVTVPADAVQFFAVTSTSNQNLLQWWNPDIGAAYVSTHVRYNAVPGSSACAFPTGPGDGTGLPVPPGVAGARDSFAHAALPNDNTAYCYAVFVEKSGFVFTVGRFAKGRPFDTTGPVKWAYSTGATAMAPPTWGSSAFALSNDRVLHAVGRGPAGGNWPAGWKPLAMNAPAQGRSPAITTNVVAGAGQIILVGSQDGSAYAVNAASGVQLWTAALGQMVQGSPSALLTSMGAAYNYVFAGTRNSTGDNHFYALSALNGTTVGVPFDNGGGATAVGVINAGSSVDLVSSRVYFASRRHPAGSNQTLWALDIGAGGVTPAWGVPLGDIDGAPTRRGTRLYVGNTSGVVHGVDTADGTSNPWSFTTGDGPVKSFVFPDRFSSALYLSTSTKVWGLDDGSPTPRWPAVTLPGPSNPLFLTNGTHLLVGAADGRLYQLDLSAAGPATPPALTSVVLGDGAAAVGSPTHDTTHNMVYVGSEAGIVYAVQLPLP